MKVTIDTNRPTDRTLGLRTGNFAYQQNVRLANMTLDLRTGHFTYEQVTLPTKTFDYQCLPNLSLQINAKTHIKKEK